MDFKPDVIHSLIELKDKFYGGSRAPVKSVPLAGAVVSFPAPTAFNLEELKSIFSRIPENIRPDVDWSKINKTNFEVSKRKLMELAE